MQKLKNVTLMEKQFLMVMKYVLLLRDNFVYFRDFLKHYFKT